MCAPSVKQTNLLAVSHGSLASNHDLASRLVLQLLSSHASRTQDSTHEVVLHAKRGREKAGKDHHIRCQLTPDEEHATETC